MMQIQCLMVAGGSMDEGLRTALYMAARSLILSGEKKTTFVDENGEGGVSTQHKRVVVGSWMTGIKFSATVETVDNTIRCEFLVNDINMPSEEDMIEKGRWL